MNQTNLGRARQGSGRPWHGLGTRVTRLLESMVFVDEDTCVYCGRPGAGALPGLCASCAAEMELVGARFPLPRHDACEPERVCHTAAFYNNFLRETFAAYKFRGAMYYEPLFQGILAEYVTGHPAFVDAAWVTFLPQTHRKEVLRGVNPARSLAEAVAGALGVPVVPLLGKRAGGRPQKEVSRSERVHNADGRFFLIPGSRGALARRVAAAGYGRGIVVDDLFTTGYTMREALRVLGEAGISAKGLCLASAGYPRGYEETPEERGR